jgi:hypothetical protein
MALAREVFCLDHYIERAYARLQATRELCQKCRPVSPSTLDALLADADFVMQALSQNGNTYAPPQRDKLLELLLCLTNLQEYLRHHAVQARADD